MWQHRVSSAGTWDALCWVEGNSCLHQPVPTAKSKERCGNNLLTQLNAPFPSRRTACGHHAPTAPLPTCGSAFCKAVISCPCELPLTPHLPSQGFPSPGCFAPYPLRKSADKSFATGRVGNVEWERCWTLGGTEEVPAEVLFHHYLQKLSASPAGSALLLAGLKLFLRKPKFLQERKKGKHLISKTYGSHE